MNPDVLLETKNPGAYAARLTWVLFEGSLFQTSRDINDINCATSKLARRACIRLNSDARSVGYESYTIFENRCMASVTFSRLLKALRRK